MTKFRDFLNEAKPKDSRGNTLRVGDWVSYEKKDWEIEEIDGKAIVLRLKSDRGSQGMKPGSKGPTMAIDKRLSNHLEQIDIPH